ncbi:MAG: DUF4097 family beta strand repeat-containing protein [Bacteroidota bacterium]
MKLLNTLTIVGLLITLSGFNSTINGQNQHKIAMKSGILVLSELMEVRVEGYSGNEVILETGRGFKIPERAKGLRPINGMGLTDNTGIGLAVKDENGVKVVYQVARNNDASYTVRVPNNVKVRYNNSSIHGEDFKAVNIKGEMEIKTHGGSIHLENVTGPMSVSTVHGDIDVIFSTVPQELPSSIVTTHGDLDVSIPKSAKANLNISTTWGEVYSDLDIKVDNPTRMKVYGAKKINGSINGGGVSMALSSTHGNVYLRGK